MSIFPMVTWLSLSETAFNGDEQLLQAVVTVEDWLAANTKLSTAAVPEMPTNVSAAAGFIGDWINTHHCN